VTRAASSLLKLGLGLSGLALKLAGDIASDLRNEAVKSSRGASSSQTAKPQAPSSSSASSSSKPIGRGFRVDAVEARAILAADPKDLSVPELVSGTRKLTKFKAAMKDNLTVQDRMVKQKQADVVQSTRKIKAGGKVSKDQILEEKVSTLQWLKKVQASMRAEYQAVMDKISEMEKALESMGITSVEGIEGEGKKVAKK